MGSEMCIRDRYKYYIGIHEMLVKWGYTRDLISEPLHHPHDPLHPQLPKRLAITKIPANLARRRAPSLISPLLCFRFVNREWEAARATPRSRSGIKPSTR